MRSRMELGSQQSFPRFHRAQSQNAATILFACMWVPRFVVLLACSSRYDIGDRCQGPGDFSLPLAAVTAVTTAGRTSPAWWAWPSATPFGPKRQAVLSPGRRT
eukprot:4773607-Prymnesium_polylepis.1